jgi:hypothetical protein
MILESIRIPLRKYVVTVHKLWGDTRMPKELLQSILQENQDLMIHDLGFLVAKLPSVKRVELKDWSEVGITVENVNMPEETSFVEYVVQKYWDDEGPNGAFILHLHDIIIDNPLEEDFVEYDSLEEWRDHLDLHDAPGDVYEILEDLWREYEREVPETLRVEVSRI